MKYSMRLVTISELSALAELGYEAFNNYSTYSVSDRLHFYTKWFNKNKKCFSFLCLDDNIIIGYFCAIPMVEVELNLHYQGLVSQFEMDSSLIVSESNLANNVYLQAVYIREEYRNPAALRCLLAGSIGAVKNITEHGKKVFLYAEQFSIKGKYLLERMNFSLTNYKSYDNFSLYTKESFIKQKNIF